MDMADLEPMGQPVPNKPSRDPNGFAIRPHHMKLYKQFAEVYKEEETERSIRWEQFLKTYGDSLNTESISKSNNGYAVWEGTRAEAGSTKEKDCLRSYETWCHVRPGLQPVERAMQHRVKKFLATQINGHIAATFFEVEPNDASNLKRDASEGSEDDSDEEFYDAERSDAVPDGLQNSLESLVGINNLDQDPCPWGEELDALVRGGVPMALRGEVWQVFMGSSPRRMHGHYQALLTLLGDGRGDGNGSGGLYNENCSDDKLSDSGILEKWTNQIEKHIPRNFPGHLALGVDGRTALRRLLIAHAHHKPNVGYRQATYFFAGLLLLMMPEENAFWTLTAMLDNCFEGYYTDKMFESQTGVCCEKVDQLVLEELVCKHFPRLMAHLEGLGVQLAWITRPWFLSIFVNVLPWESVLRIWDVLLFEGNRSMLFKTTLALLELHGSALMSTKDAGDAITKLESLARATFDSSLLVLTACVGYQSVHESQLQELRQKHRPNVLAPLSDQTTDQSVWHKAFGPMAFSSKFSQYDKTLSVISNGEPQRRSGKPSPISDGSSVDTKAALNTRGLEEGTVLADLVNEVKYLKLELSKTLEEGRVANIRADELETAFMELVKEDNRRLLTAKMETLEAEAASLKQALAFKVEQEQAMVQVMVRMEQEQRAAEDARQLAVEGAERQQIALDTLQAKYDSIISSLKELEKRVEAAEGMLEATTNSSHDGREPSRWSSWTWTTPK